MWADPTGNTIPAAQIDFQQAARTAPSEYYKFFCAVKGFKILRADGLEMAKFELWEKVRKNPDELKQVKARCHPMYSFVEKPLWTNGLYGGEFDEV